MYMIVLFIGCYNRAENPLIQMKERFTRYSTEGSAKSNDVFYTYSTNAVIQRHCV